jgi:hypothetical protein
VARADPPADWLLAAAALDVVRRTVVAWLLMLLAAELVLWVDLPALRVAFLAVELLCMTLAATGARRFARTAPRGRPAAAVAWLMFFALAVMTAWLGLATLGLARIPGAAWQVYQIASGFSVAAMLLAVHATAVVLARADLSRRARITAAVELVGMIVVGGALPKVAGGALVVVATIAMVGVQASFWLVLGATREALCAGVPAGRDAELPRATVVPS